ncbi:MAG: cob(I)yrinic acid a,c-diamide adenosyltransferase, partial [Lachnospiraceae bacterium]|nr:cob(I)yrinic acid a,c-diamide adenosyltransferase [Lachnospiraceae bacterium]
GLAARALGAGRKVLVARFLKNNESAEIGSLEKLGARVLPVEKVFNLIYVKKEDIPKEAGEYYTDLFCRARDEALAGAYDLVVLDEIAAAARLELVDVSLITEFIKEKPDSMEIVMTGRKPPEELLELSDYVSEVKKIKHPMDRGIMARKGIEY